MVNTSCGSISYKMAHCTRIILVIGFSTKLITRSLPVWILIILHTFKFSCNSKPIYIVHVPYGYLHMPNLNMLACVTNTDQTLGEEQRIRDDNKFVTW